jgi:RNA polymerase sigma-70 factor (ECF subfamily)
VHNEKTLLLKVADGNESAFRELFHQYWDNIYGVALMFTKSKAMAEDVVQEIFLKIWIRREQLKEVEQFSNYLFIMTRNHVVSALRKHIRQQSFTNSLIEYFSVADITPENQLLTKETAQLIHQAIEQLPQQQKLVYQMTRKQDLSQEEIAAQLNISRNTVRNHMARALHSIRNYLEAHANELILFICLIIFFV